MYISDFSPQMTHIHIYAVCGTVETLIPDVFQDHGAGKYPSSVCHQVLKHSVFLGSEFHPLAGPLHLLRKAVQFQISYSKHACSGHGATTEQGFDANQKLSKRKRFGQVVVSASLEVLDFIAQRISRGQNQNGNLRIGPSNPMKDSTTCKAWKHQVENNKIVLIGLGKFPATHAIASCIDREALSGQTACEESRNLLFIFDDKDTHLSNSPKWNHRIKWHER